ncbi:MAG: uroporphyrinogen-III synthase [Parvularculaceae bacterium]|nr:uroporphyrinogen-III synthase [Parvularculaceae bacterium]
MQAPEKTSVIVTRPAPDAAAFASLLAGRGMTAILSPVLRIDPIDISGEIGRGEALAFTSANAVRSYLQSGGAAGLRVYAVGEATAEAARAAGFGDVIAGASNADALSALIAAQAPERRERVLHVVGREETGDLVGRLRQAGVEARRVVGYAATPIETISREAAAALERGGAWVAHFSPRSARLFCAAASAAALDAAIAKTGAACLSAAVAEAAGPGWARKAVAVRPTAGALIDAIAAAR